MSDRIVAGWQRVFAELFPRDRIDREKRVDLAITGDGGVRGSQVRGALSDEATPVVDAEQMPAPDGSGYNNAKELFDAMLAAAMTYVLKSGDTMTGDLEIQVTSATSFRVRKASAGNTVFQVNSNSTPGLVSLQNGADLRLYSDAGTTETGRFDGATGDLTINGNTTLGDGDGDVTIQRGHMRHRSAAPTIAVGAALGTGGSVGATITGSDQSGEMVLTAGTASLTTGLLATITFNTARPNTNYSVVVTPRGSNAGVNAIQYYATRATTTTWTISCNVAPTSGLLYSYHYEIREWTNS